MYYLEYEGHRLNGGKGYPTQKEAEYHQGLIVINYGYIPKIVKV